MTARVTVADYGIGNLLSVRRALEHCGAEVEMSTDPLALERAQRLVLPGVGAFRDGMAGLRVHGFVEPLRRFAASGRPFLGICVGMQVMFEAGEEHGMHEGLGLLPGRVVQIPPATDRKIPHVGWSALVPASQRDWSGTILEGTVPAATSVYFVHSYHARADQNHALAVSDYAGCQITAVVSHGNLHGCQFHPEKSGKAGLAIISRFLALS
jgi:glutamine amidotransferase